MSMSDVHTATSHRSSQTAERDAAPHVVSSAWGEAAARAGDLPLTPGVAQVLQSRTDRDPRLPSAEICESAHLKLILVDKKPFGVSNELAPGLRLLHGRGALPKVVLLLRDILDDQETTTATWERNRYHDAVRSFYDRILVVGSPEIFNLATEYKFP